MLRIEPCPPIEPGDGQVVTATFHHQAATTVDVHVEGLDTPIGCTGNHPFWSEDRQTFVRADALQPGEHLRTFTDIAVVTRIAPRSDPTPVYNIEVQGEHVYHVAENGVLVHNSKPCNESWKDYLKKEIGDPPAHMTHPHAHHILMKEGKEGVQRELVEEGQKILRRYDIDPIEGYENLVWAEQYAHGQHTTETLERIVEALRELDAKEGVGYDDFVELLKRFGEEAAARTW
ncbi:MAG: polymorphic toxin-type HINT domain-containing protein [Planctomycetia bacterium]